MLYAISNLCSCFSTLSIGTKVLDEKGFFSALDHAIEQHDLSKDRAEGQHFVSLPTKAYPCVSAGVGKKTQNADDYVIRVHRGQPTLFLKRAFAAPVEGLACVVYTQQAYLQDPDVLQDTAEHDRVAAMDCIDYVIVAVLAFAGPQSPLTPHRLVHNLAGGNNEVASWTKEEIQEKAKASLEYWNTWEVVAD